MTTKRKILISVIAVIVIGAGFGIKFVMDMQNEQKELAAMNIQEIDLCKVADGSYKGAYKTTLIKVKVVVEVKDHEISAIEFSTT